MHTLGQSIKLTTLLICMGALTFVLYAKTGITSPDHPAHEIRMAVDPTILPPILPPAEDDLPPEPETSSAPLMDEVELPEIETRTPLPKPPGKETEEKTKPAPAPKAEVKPAPKADPIVPPKKSDPPAQPKTGKGAISKITMDSTDREFILTVYCDRPVGDTTYLNLSNPKRLVIDLREPWSLNTKNVVRVKSGVVKHVVVGSHPDRLRMVIHFRTPPKGSLAPKFIRTGNKLIVSTVLP